MSCLPACPECFHQTPVGLSSSLTPTHMILFIQQFFISAPPTNSFPFLPVPIPPINGGLSPTSLIRDAGAPLMRPRTADCSLSPHSSFPHPLSHKTSPEAETKPEPQYHHKTKQASYQESVWGGRSGRMVWDDQPQLSMLITAILDWTSDPKLEALDCRWLIG